MSLINNIRKLCEVRGIKLETLGTELGIGAKAIYKWDSSSPKIDTLQKVADYFKVSTDYLFYGFNRSLFAATLRIIMNGRTLEKYSQDTGILMAEIAYMLEGIAEQRPPLEYIEKIIQDNPIKQLIDHNELLRAAGYDPDEIKFKKPIIDLFPGAGEMTINTSDFFNKNPNPLSPKENRDIARDLEKMLSDLESDEAMAFHGEPMDDDDKELLRISLESSMRLAKQIAKKKFTPKKYRKED